MTSKTLKEINISDVHNGPKRDPSQPSLSCLYDIIRDPDFRSVDIFYINGDFFDESLNFSDDEIGPIQLWIADLLFTCKRHDVLIRVLEGTPSHDRGQNKAFIDAEAMLKTGCDIRYHDTLAIEYISKFDINVLFVPDEYHTTTDETKQAVMDLLEVHNLEQVDFAKMHGAFAFQYPEHVDSPVHDIRFYESIVKHTISIGHVHIPTILGKVIATGSLDRICHGEEHPKGWMECTYFLDNPEDRSLVFKENKKAMTFKTVDITKLDDDEIRGVLDDTLIGINHEGNIRIRHRADQKFNDVIEFFKETFQLVKWVMKREKVKTVNEKVFRPTLCSEVVINSNSIVDLVRGKLSHETDIDMESVIAELDLIK